MMTLSNFDHRPRRWFAPWFLISSWPLWPTLATGVFAADVGMIEVHGSIKLEDHTPAAFANIYVENTRFGTASDANGEFRLLVPDSCVGRKLTISYIGYENHHVSIEQPRPSALKITLREKKNISLSEVTVSAKPILKALGVKKDFLGLVIEEVQAVDIVDLSSRMPGAQSRDNDSHVYVRGGERYETKFILDGAYLLNPYLANTGIVGFGAMLSIFDTHSYFYSSGGFSAKYTDALSGVVEVKSQDFQPDYRRTLLAAGLSGLYALSTFPVSKSANVQAEVTAIDTRFSFAGNKQIFPINDELDIFTNHPRGMIGKLHTNFDLGGSGKLKFSTIYSQSLYGLSLSFPEDTLVFDNQEKNFHSNLLFSKFLSRRFGVECNVAFSGYEYRSTGNVYSMDYGASLLQSNLYGSYYFDDDNDVQFGINAHQYYLDLARITNESFGQSFLEASVDGNKKTGQAGLFVDYNHEFNGQLSFNFGLRRDAIEGSSRFDPRFGLMHKYGPWSIKLAAGRYTQMQELAKSLYRLNGSPLRPQSANHLMLDSEYEGKRLNVTAGIYYKRYHSLPLLVDEFYTSGGKGQSYGVDLQVKYKSRLKNKKIVYSLSTSCNRSRRKQEEYLTVVPAILEIPFSLYSFIKLNVTPKLQLNLIQSFAMGRPYSDSAALLQDKRLPSTKSTDLQLNYFTLWHGWEAVLFLAYGNIFQNKNLFGFNYSSDYSERTPQYTGSITGFNLGLTLAQY